MNEDQAPLLRLQIETTATIAVLQAQVAALIATHPDRPAVQRSFLGAMETHLARALGSPLPDQMADALARGRQTVLQEIFGANSDS